MFKSRTFNDPAYVASLFFGSIFQTNPSDRLVSNKESNNNNGTLLDSYATITEVAFNS